MDCALPGDAIALTPDALFAIDSLVDALLDAVDPNLLTMSSRLIFRPDRAEAVIIAHLYAAQWELSVESWARVVGDLCIRSHCRPLNLPSIAGAMQTLLDGGHAALHRAAAYNFRGAH